MGLLSLWEHFGNLTESYYRIRIDNQALFSTSRANDNCREFIEEHFEKGKKNGVFAITESYRQRYMRNGRHVHSVVLYLLGLLIGENIVGHRRRVPLGVLPDTNWCEFRYQWFLTCLYHDVVSTVERDSRYREMVEDISETPLFTNYPELLRYKKETYENYVKYRRDQGAAEHGIIAGANLYRELERNFYEQTAGHDWNAQNICRRKGLSWRLEHLPHFAYVADAICCHNIWLAPERDKTLCSTYVSAGLQELIVKGEKNKLSFERTPLQFILCLLDTIEPTKRFADISAKEVLENILVNVTKNGLVIGWTKQIREQFQFSDWLGSVRGMKEWMKIDITPCEHRDDICLMEILWEAPDF